MASTRDVRRIEPRWDLCVLVSSEWWSSGSGTWKHQSLVWGFLPSQQGRVLQHDDLADAAHVLAVEIPVRGKIDHLYNDRSVVELTLSGLCAGEGMFRTHHGF